MERETDLAQAEETLLRLFPPHPVLVRPTVEEMLDWGPERTIELSGRWHQAVEAAKVDQFNAGYRPPAWGKAKALLDEEGVARLHVLGGNRGSKTTFAAWMVVNAAINNPGTRIMCWAQNEKISNWQQQSAVYNMLPPAYREKKRGEVVKMSYSVANGFTDNNFILENGSHVIFMFYTQFMQDPSCIEGYELGWKGEWKEKSPETNLGCWFDEYLGDPGLMETMEARLTTRDAKCLTTVTPVFQYTEGIRYMIEGAQTVESVVVSEEDFPPDKFPGIAGEVVPLVQKGRRKGDRIFFLHTKTNKFNNFERFRDDLESKSKGFILMKAFGVPSKVSASKFPKFSGSVNVLEELPEGKYTRYHIVDPAGDKPWTMIWVAVDQEGQHFVYREWPSLEQWGPWAEWKDGKWVPGEAATGECCGMGYESYQELFEEEERDEEIFERLIDPRMGSMATPGRSHSTSIIAEMEDLGVNFAPAPGLPEQDGIQRLQELMDYDVLQPVSQINKPKLFMLSCCGNMIKAMSGYDSLPGKADLKHPWKDFVDVLRYMAVSDLDYVIPEEKQQPTVIGGY